jgi:hypothetical protein
MKCLGHIRVYRLIIPTWENVFCNFSSRASKSKQLSKLHILEDVYVNCVADFKVVFKISSTAYHRESWAANTDAS